MCSWHTGVANWLDSENAEVFFILYYGIMLYWMCYRLLLLYIHIWTYHTYHMLSNVEHDSTLRNKAFVPCWNDNNDRRSPVNEAGRPLKSGNRCRSMFDRIYVNRRSLSRMRENESTINTRVNECWSAHSENEASRACAKTNRFRDADSNTRSRERSRLWD